MSGVRIPEAAYIAAALAYECADQDSGWSEAVDAAAALVVAAELRRIAETWSPEPQPQIMASSSSYVRRSLLNRVDELDPEGLTRD